MAKLFGTDGARGIAITELTCETAMQIGRAAALVLTKTSHRKPTILIGKDTRISSDILESALIAGICSVGADALTLGVIPTPAVANLILSLKADAGVMISASHNSFEFNGIKLFGADGFKLPDKIEEEIEELVRHEFTLVNGEAVGHIYNQIDAFDRYIHSVKTQCSDLSGLKIAVDCANGSATMTAEALFKRLGAEILVLSDKPNGININENCGSTHMGNLQKFVLENRCDAGFAFDGDADRCLAVDECGNIVDGDKLLAIIAKENGYSDIVVTVMTNLGFHKFAAENGINVHTVQVGDRYVLEEMRREGFKLGGEQSGHIIFYPESTTGDGELTAVKIAEIIKRTGKKFSQLAAVMTVYPQVLKNVRVSGDVPLPDVTKYEEILGNDGRILIRKSGTEPLIRVMLEGKNLDEITRYADEICEKLVTA
ncbi:MAG: phosphoglucosamine mutase [Ruminococcus sp.]|jgi:phosphoglucosamine mutase|nr:phosphoglucosamine mutase [Ruminococcus sp.]